MTRRHTSGRGPVRHPHFGHAHPHPVPTPAPELARFEASAGLAFGTYARYVYGPFAAHHLNDAAAATAARATLADVQAAKQQATGGTAVREMYGQLAALEPLLQGIVARLHHGTADPGDITAANSAIRGVQKTASAAGVDIRAHAPATAP